MTVVRVQRRRRALSVALLVVALAAAWSFAGSHYDWDPSGQAMPVGDVPGWHQVFADNFSDEDIPVGAFSGCTPDPKLLSAYCAGLPASPAGRWWAYPDGWRGTPRTGTYYPSRVVSIHGGVMTYKLHTANVDGRMLHMIAAAVPKIPGGEGRSEGLLYGRYLIRARFDRLYGYHVSFLLWPDSGVWPRDGEIDWPEADLDSQKVSAFMHWQNATAAGQQDVYSVRTNLSQWHTYEIDWTARQCSFFLDGSLVGKATNAAEIPSTAMHLVLQVGTSGVERALADATAGRVQIDWVVVYRPS